MCDEDHMRHALTLAERALGRVAPNPAVGCVIVAPDGRDRRARLDADLAGGRMPRPWRWRRRARQRAGRTAYVTLEPCAHHGQTPPCAEALIEAGVARVVAAVEDPDPRVAARDSRSCAPPASRSRPACWRTKRQLSTRAFSCALNEDRPLGDAEDRPERWTARPLRRSRRQQMDHRRGGAPLRASAARPPRRDPGRHRDGAGGRSGADLPPAGPGRPLAAARRARHPAAAAGIRKAGRAPRG